ncbi:MAG: dipeptidase [Bernardetiaceae bacterium]
MTTLATYIQTHQERFIEELKDYLRQPSVSAKSEHHQDVLRTAEYLQKAFREIGMDKAEICPTKGFPVVYAEKIIDPEAPTVLVYGHYDVQPPEPLELWKSDPFDPEVRDGYLYARGADDNKGQFWAQFKALEVLQQNGGLPCNVKFMVEGEEEVGSDSLPEFLTQHKAKLAADVIILSDTTMLSAEIPSITTGLRGLSYVEVTVTGPNRDLHSGLYGGVARNPINALAQMIASLHDAEGRITIPGFYDRVLPISDAEAEALRQVPISDQSYRDSLELDALYGETGYSAFARTTIRPTLDVNGIWGGYTGEGAKTVIPSEAHAKLSMRLVPDQDPDEITQLFTEHFLSIAPAGVRVLVRPHHGGQPMVTSTDSVAYRAAESAYEAAFGVKPLAVRGGGSIPIVSLFREILGLEAIMMGFGLNENAIHSPNERMSTEIILKGIHTVSEFYQRYAQAVQAERLATTS